MKRMILRALQEDIDEGRHSAYTCPIAKGMQRATGLRWAVASMGAATTPASPGDDFSVFWGATEPGLWIARYDSDESVEPFEGIIEVPDGCPVLDGYLAGATS